MKFRFCALVIGCWFTTPSHAMGYSTTYVSCINAARSSTSSIAECMHDEFNIQNKRVKYYFKIILDQYASSEKKAQKKIQKQWFISRDTSCGKKNKSQSEGHFLRYYSCALKSTVQQANSLERQTYRYRSVD